MNNSTGTSIPKQRTLDIKKIRDEFPMLQKKIKGKQIIYLDSAATGQKPKRVIDRLTSLYLDEYGKPKESHYLSQEITKQLDAARKKTASFLGAKSEEEIIFSRGCTESINIVAGGFERGLLKNGDSVVITALEHHANIVPWQLACAQTGALLKVVPVNNKGEVDMAAYAAALSEKTKIVSVSHTSHALGNKLPVKDMVRLAHQKNIPVMLDGAQAAPHMPVDMQELDCDFYTFSGHKMGSPSGVGVLYGKKEWLEKLPPFEGGADMATEVTFEKPTLADPPEKFEAGTMPFAEIIAFGTLIDYLKEIDMHKTEQYEQELLAYATEALSVVDRVQIMGTANEKEPVLSFALDKLDVKKLERFLNDAYNIDVRAGDLTAQPLMKILGVPALLRASFCYYNTFEEIDTFVGAVGEYIKRNG
jgi:cysteine desulfurase/selenocysteine lyase